MAMQSKFRQDRDMHLQRLAANETGPPADLWRDAFFAGEFRAHAAGEELGCLFRLFFSSHLGGCNCRARSVFITYHVFKVKVSTYGNSDESPFSCI